MKLFDLLAVLASLAVVAAFSVNAYGRDVRKPLVAIEAPGGRWIYPASVDRRIAETASSGGCLIAIESGSVRVVSSDCPNRICIRSGSISRPGQWIACLPHRVFIRIEGEPAEPTDAVSF